MLSCPGCGALTHADELKRLAAAAPQAAPAEALALWRQAMALLPRDSAQAKVIAGKIETLSRLAEKGAPPAAGRGKWKSAAASGGVFLMLLAKFKTAIFLLLGQGKLLLLGLTKMATLGSMFVTCAVFWRAFGDRKSVV